MISGKNIFNTIIETGITNELEKQERQSVILCNSLSIFFAITPILFTVLVWMTHGTGRFSWPLLIQPLVMLTPIIANYLGFVVVSRILLSWLSPVMVITYSIYNKSQGIDLETSSYVGFRITMIAASIIPFLVFSLQNKGRMFIAFIVPLTCILGFDPIHDLFGVGYTQVGLAEASYRLNNIRAFIGLLITGSVPLLLKSLVEKSEAENTLLLSELNDAHHQLKIQFEEIMAQNEKIKIQNEQIQNQHVLLENRYHEIVNNQQNLVESRRNLERANEIIEGQKQILANENKQLELELLERNKALEKSNLNLVKYNKNLTQYSYMVSHNLRGPVASIMGLLSIVPKEKLDPELNLIYEKVGTSTQALDAVIRDISSIIDTQKNLALSRQKIYWKDSVTMNLMFFQNEIEKTSVVIKTDFIKAPLILSVKTIIDSIIYNLISNAIKYRSSIRQLNIEIETYHENECIVFRIKDNGMGIDLNTQKENLFRMYKRFHTHTEGRGLGLYLVKLQVELLSGEIEVDSEVDRYTMFTLRFPLIPADEQIQ